jgi:hypothetical protein
MQTSTQARGVRVDADHEPVRVGRRAPNDESAVAGADVDHDAAVDVEQPSADVYVSKSSVSHDQHAESVETVGLRRARIYRHSRITWATHPSGLQA